MRKTLSEIEAGLGCSRFDVGNWLSRLRMVTAFEVAGRGRARRFSYENALELGLLAALSAAGVPPSRSYGYRAAILRRAGCVADPVPTWLVVVAGAVVDGLFSVTADGAEIASRLDAVRAPAVALVHVAEVFRRVDALFGGGRRDTTVAASSLAPL